MDKSIIVAALDRWIRQRPGLDFGNYRSVWSYRAELRSITKDLRDARTMLDYIAWHDSITAADILAAFDRGGRFTCTVNGDKVTLDYCVGQYWPTEYRRAACAVLSSVIWSWLCSNMPKGELMHNSETGETLERYEGMRAGDYLRKAAARELGRSIAQRWFK